MAIEQDSQHLWHISPGPLDVHTHPRAFDPITRDNFVEINEGQEGKAGLSHFTEVALRSGIVAMLAMPNESRRIPDATAEERTVLIPHPIASLERVAGMQGLIIANAKIPTGIYMGLDPEACFRDAAKTLLNTKLLEKEFTLVADECTSLKVYLGETTGGYNVAMEHAMGVADVWYRTNPGKPIVYHVEGADVSKLLRIFSEEKRTRQGKRYDWGKEVPIHIAHVSSRQELEAIIVAKAAGMNVTCEATPHHLFLDNRTTACMKPGLKTQADVDFIWAHIDKVDMFASDCAPHRRSDKEGENPAYGVTNHTVMLPLLVDAVNQGKLTMDQLYDKLCVQPRKRFNLDADDGSRIIIDSGPSFMTALAYERRANARYGVNPFTEMSGHASTAGRVVSARSGNSAYTAGNQEYFEPSYTHLIRPKNVGSQALRLHSS